MARIEYQVGTDLEYAPFVEFGTSKMPAQPYLRPAFDQNATAVQAEIGRVLGAAIQAAAS